VALVGRASGLGRDLATALAERGARVVALTDDLASTAALTARLSDVASELGGTPGLVRLAAPGAAAAPGELASLNLAEWTERAEAPLREVLAFHQAAQRFLANRGGSVVAVVPTIGLSGAAGYVPWASVAEAERSLVKAQARVSGRHGVTLNCVTCSSRLLAGSPTDLDRSGLPPLALDAPTVGALATVVLDLLGPGFAAVTGQTIAVDGGRWMAP
jgi:3-oxoacyl-[acyl-carrier protein] reductase